MQVLKKISIPLWKKLIIRFLLLVVLTGNLYYLSWRFNTLFWTNRTLSGLLLLTELVFFANFLIHFPVLWLKKPKNILTQIPKFTKKLAILIPTYNEPLNILSQTIEQSLAIAIPQNLKVKIVVLDDGNRDWLKKYVKELAKTTSVTLEYLTRTERFGYKAGNINNYLKSVCQEDFILVLDADFVPFKNILEEFYPYLGIEKLGFVQAPQFFNNIAKGDPFGQDPAIWFSLLQVGRYGQNALICCGSPTLWSVPALQSIGYMQYSVTEDFLTGAMIQSKGWQAIYLQKDVAEGKASEDIIDVKKKTLRYSSGAFEFFSFAKKLLANGHLSLRQRFLHFTYPLAFVAPLLTPILIAIPILSILTGISPFVIDQSSYPHLLSQIIALISFQIIFFLAVGKKAWKSWQFYLGMFPVYTKALLQTIFGKTVFQVSKKGVQSAAAYAQLKAVRLQIFILLLSWVTFFKGLLLFRENIISISLYPALFWLLLNNFLLFGVIKAPLYLSWQQLLTQIKELGKNKLNFLFNKKFALMAFIFLIIAGAGSMWFRQRSVPNIEVKVQQTNLNKMKNNLDLLTTKLSLNDDRRFQTLLFFTDWGDNKREVGQANFYLKVEPSLNLAYENQLVPIITWEPVKKNLLGEFAEDITLKSIREGQSDQYLIGWRNGLQEWMDKHPGYEVRIRLMHEMNAPIDRYHWSHVSPAEYRASYEYVYNLISQVNGNLKWMAVFQNFTADAGWTQKRAKDYDRYIPNIPVDYIGIDGYSRPFLAGKDGPPGGEVTPAQVLPRAFFKAMREAYPQAKLVISETAVPYMPKTDEALPYPAGELSYQMTDLERAAWINDFKDYLLEIDQDFGLEEMTWFNGNTDYHWSIFAEQDQLTIAAFKQLMLELNKAKIKIGIYPGE